MKMQLTMLIVYLQKCTMIVDGICIIDTDGVNGICDELEVSACTDEYSL